MKVHVHTDHNLVIDTEIEARVAATTAAALASFGPRIVRVDLHLTDQSGGRKAGAHVRCVAEAHPSGLSPVTVSVDAADVRAALDGAVGALATALEHTFSRRADKSLRSAVRRP
jgi:hypothetical protein